MQHSIQRAIRHGLKTSTSLFQNRKLSQATFEPVFSRCSSKCLPLSTNSLLLGSYGATEKSFSELHFAGNVFVRNLSINFNSTTESGTPEVKNEGDKIEAVTEESIEEYKESAEELSPFAEANENDVSQEDVANADDTMKLYFGNLPEGTDEEGFHIMLKEVLGDLFDDDLIQEITVPTDRNTGAPRKFAFAVMDTELAKQAIMKINGLERDGKIIKCAEQMSAEEMQAKRAEASSRNIYIGNINFSTTESDLIDLFKDYGAIEQCRFPVDINTGLTKGYAFVKMEDKQDAETAIGNLDGLELHGRTINVQIARPRGENVRRNNVVQSDEFKTTLFIGNLPYDTRERSVLELFEPYGSVLNFNMPKDTQSGTCRGFAFITMSKEDSSLATDQLNGRNYGGRELYVSKARPREQRDSPPPRDYFDDFGNDDYNRF